MAKICVIYASEDEAVTGSLVTLLRRDWEDVWWARDIPHGDWETHVRGEIRAAQAVVPVMSPHFTSSDICRDELGYAKKQGRPILPFVVAATDIPLGFDHLNRTEAFGWVGDPKHRGFEQLLSKLGAVLEPPQTGAGGPQVNRVKALTLGDKRLSLPCFAFSLSSHETQIRPKEGVKLFDLLPSSTVLVSAYDAYRYRSDRAFLKDIRALIQSPRIFFLDSGNYEAYRKDDRWSRRNKTGWHKSAFREMVVQLGPDIAFAFDTPNPEGSQGEVVKRAVRAYGADQRAIGPSRCCLCPIVHLPRTVDCAPVAKYAAAIVSRVARELDPVMIAIPERELGDGIVQRAKCVRRIRQELDASGKYCPLHLLGTGNPISMLVFAVAGADSFDGLEWCRTVAEYDSGQLFHFQHFDCFRDRYVGRLQDEPRKIVENRAAPYGARIAAYNMSFFREWERDMQQMIHAGQGEQLLKMRVPNIGAALCAELRQ